MNEQKPPTWFWIVAVLAVLWNLMGIGAYVADVTMTTEALGELSEAEQTLRASIPAWVTGVYAVAVFAGAAAAVLLCLRRGLAVPLYIVSLVAVVVQMGYVFGIADAAAVLGSGSMFMPAVIVLLGALQLWFSVASKRRAWLS